MQDLVIKIKDLKLKIRNGQLSIEETIVLLSDIIDKFNKSEDQDDSEKNYLKSLIQDKIIVKFNIKNKKSELKIKVLKIFIILNEIGVKDVTKEDIKMTLYSR